MKIVDRCSKRVAILASIGALAFAAVAQAQTFKFANQGDALSMDPHSLNESLQLSFTGNIYEPLIARGKKLGELPSRATAAAASLLLLVATLPLRAEPLVAVPPLASPVTDLTGTLTAEQAATLDARLRAFEAERGSQVAVLLVPTTEPEAIEQYAMRVADAWQLGRKGVDDGALLLVALQDRAVRIEVGYGLEGPLPDAVANRIIDEEILPPFRRGDVHAGISAAVDRMLRVIEGEPLPAPAARSPAQDVPGLFQSHRKRPAVSG